ncbi:hypothetical protein JTE90_011784 [Oedothorax gibbosus]|uniref:RRM domain-containing protein n=1 Tax=Oedothorax gibbosus TaxID=931172 RepID=A0AAV6VSU9_9ARAC|nr:hypothetical protein JTE90_011784 [Oedothorax gibbosus]
MVFMKKGSTPNKNQQQLKKGKATPSKQAQEFQDMDDSDDDVDSDDAPQLQKTPLNKGAKGRQSMSEKKVSFSIPGKNSPAVKTPKDNNATLAKKQPTPAAKGKTSMQEFKGMKGKKAQADDDEDDEDDDDFEMDDEDIELAMGDSDEDDDDDDDEEDDDDDEEEEDEEASNKVASPKKSPKKEKAEEKPAVDDKLKGEILKDEAERRKERNARMLYIGKLPKDVTEQELKSLSKDVVEVSIPMGNRKNSARSLYAFLTFDTEAKSDANFKSFQTKKFRGQPLTVDYVDATLCDVAKHFKKAFQITFNTCPTFRTATISFLTEKDAKAAYDTSKDISVGGLKLTVLYSRQGAAPEISKKKNRGKRSRNDKQNGGHQNAKRMKTSN